MRKTIVINGMKMVVPDGTTVGEYRKEHPEAVGDDTFIKLDPRGDKKLNENDIISDDATIQTVPRIVKG